MRKVFDTMVRNSLTVITLLAAVNLSIASATEAGRVNVAVLKKPPVIQGFHGLAVQHAQIPLQPARNVMLPKGAVPAGHNSLTSPAVPPSYTALESKTLPGSRELSGEGPQSPSQNGEDQNVSEKSNSAEAETAGSAQIFLLAAALCSALAGTTVVLYVISKRSYQKEEAKTVSAEVKEAARLKEPMPARAERKSVEQLDVSVAEETVPEEPAVELAQRFQRGQGEMQLLLNMQARESGEAPAARLLQIIPQTAGKEKTRKGTKRLGVGKGEAELLARLQHYGVSTNHPQRML